MIEAFEQMEQTSSRLALTDYLVALLKKTPPGIIDKVTYLIQGKLYPDYEGIELGLAEKMAIRAIAGSSGMGQSKIEKIYQKTGDLGDAAGEAMKSKSQSTLFSEPMTVERVYSTFDKVARTAGSGSQETKLRMISSLLNDATAAEGRYIIKFVMGQLRLGIADYTVLDALALAFTGDKANRQVLENAYNVSSDLGTVAKLLATKGLEAVRSIKITLFKPIRPMLAERIRTAEEALERMEGKAAVEYKLDGERVQVHKGKNSVELFSRRLEKITSHYPDVVKAVRSIKPEVILEGEVVAINLQTEGYLPFQELMRRFRRVHNVAALAREMPLALHFFDCLMLDGRSLGIRMGYFNRDELVPAVRDDMIASMTPGDPGYALWPDLAPSKARNNLRITLSYVRKLLEPDRHSHEASFHVRRRDDDIHLNRSEFLEVDLWAMTDELDEGRAAERSGRLADAIPCYRRAVDLWDGEILTDLRACDAVAGPRSMRPSRRASSR